MYLKKSVIISLLMMFFLVGCSGGDRKFGLGNGGNTSTDGGTGTGSEIGGSSGTDTSGENNTTIGSVGLVVLDTDAIMTANGIETTVVRVTVLNTDDNALEGAPVSFSAELGTLSAATATTNSSGIAEVILTSPIILGTGAVRASASGITSSPVSLTFIAGPPANIAMQSTPSTVGISGSATVLVSVTDANNLPVQSNNLTFFLETDQSGASLSALTQVTNTNGQASIIYTAGTTSGTDTLGVRASNGQIDTLDIAVTASSVTINSITMTLGASTIVADGSTNAAIRATVRDTLNASVAGVTVNFSSSLGSLSSGTAVTDSNGVAQVTLTSGTNLGTAVLNASTSGFSQSGSVSFVAGPPASITASASPSSVGVGAASTVNVTVRDATGHLIAGESVSFNITTNISGGDLSALTATTNVNGVAKATYTSGISAGVDVLTITSQTSGSVNASLSLTVNASTVSVNALEMFVGANTLSADGVSQTTVRATVNDVNGDPIPGKAVSFTTSAGTFSGGSSAVTDENGEAEVILVSSTNLGGAVVVANSDGVLGTTTVQFVAGSASAMTISAAPSSLNFASISALSVKVVDAEGHPVPSEVVSFSDGTNVSGGSLSATQVSTDVNGRASVNYTSGNSAGTDIITATLVNGASISQNLIVSASVPLLGTLTFEEPSGDGEITADGSSFTLLRATVLDINNVPVEAVSVSFTTSAGDFNSAGSAVSATSVTTDSNGLAELFLYSQTTVDTAQVTASVGGFNKSVSIDFVPGVASSSNSSISSSPASLPADGLSETTVTVILADAQGNRVKDGKSITLQTTAGVITSTNPVQTSSGQVSFTLRSSSESGVATLSAKEVSGLSGSVSFGSNSDNESANIILAAAQPNLSVAGVGQTENTTINISIVEVDGDPINETNWGAGVNTARVSFKSRPNGGEFLSGVNASGTVVDTNLSSTIDVVTTNGSAQVNLQAGTLPGVVEIQVEALDQTGVPYTNSVSAVLSTVSIASGSAHTLVFSFPVNALENLNDATPRIPGFYRKSGGLTVTDRYGNAVPDGSVINLGLTDSVIATGTTGSIAASSAVLTDAGVKLSDGTATSFDTALVTRSGTDRFIEDNDRILAFNAQAEDKLRFVAASAATTVTGQSGYSKTTANVNYIVGASLLGASIAGYDESTGKLTNGLAITKDGLAQIRVTYPADINSITTGRNTDLDTRVQPYNSGQVYLIAQASSSGATVINSSSDFSPIAGYTVTASIDKASDSSTFYVEVEDGGDKVNVPFTSVSTLTFIDERGSFNACVSPAFTNQGACDAAGDDWYSGRDICIDLNVTDKTICTAGGNSWLENVASRFSVNAFVGDSSSQLAGRVEATATHTTRLPVLTDTDGDTIDDFYVHPYTNSAGFADVRLVVTGSPFILSGDKATITILSGDGSDTVTVEIP